MKKAIAALLIFCLGASLFACGGMSQTSNANVDAKYAAQKADEMILAIGDVTLENETTVIAAKAYYDTLADESKSLVENLPTLESAIAHLEELKLEQQYTLAVSYEDARNAMAAKVIYESLPQDYKDVAERIATMNDYLACEGTWYCDNVNVVGSDGKIYQPNHDTYQLYVTPTRYDTYANIGWTAICYGLNRTYREGVLPFESKYNSRIHNFRTGPLSYSSQGDYYGFQIVGFYGDTNGNSKSVDVYIHVYPKDEILKAKYITIEKKTDKEVTVEFTYHKK